MHTQRSTILSQLAAGQISAAEAARRLRELSPGSAPASASHWLHFRVTDLYTGQQKVNLDLPLAWVQWQMRLGAQSHPEIAGIDFVEIVDQVRTGAGGKLVEVEDLDDQERVEIVVD